MNKEIKTDLLHNVLK